MRKFSFLWNGVNHEINTESQPFVVAEIGHNHGGNIETCKKMIEAAKNCGCNAVKLQKRNNKKLFTNGLYHMIYDNPQCYYTGIQY